MSRRPFLLAFGACVVIGAWMRLDQILFQVLLDDEWHSVHRITYYDRELSWLTLGDADYSIPLTQLYYTLAKWPGLGELTLRGPMLLAGIATVFLLPWGLRGRIEGRALVLFALLLATSPILVSFSRIARPYAVTLLLACVAFGCLARALRDGEVRWRLAGVYALVCGLVAWMHAIAAPLLVAPLVALAWGTLRGRGPGWRAVVAIGVLTGVAMGAAILPPWIADPHALAQKAGRDQVALDTFVGAVHLWLGTKWGVMAIVGLAFAAFGATAVFRAVVEVRWILLGVALTLFALLASQPWWVDRPLALARYLLPIAPVLLLAAAVGLLRCTDAIAGRFGSPDSRSGPSVAAACVLALAWFWASPQRPLLASPNSYTQHSYFQLDYREGHNSIPLLQRAMPRSSLWAELARLPPGSVKVAVAPFFYTSFEWAGPEWERESRQRVIPAYLWETCVDKRHGEAPSDRRFRRLRNAVFIGKPETMRKRHVKVLAYYRSPDVPGFTKPPAGCEAWMRERFGAPFHEDAALVAWRIDPAFKLLPAAP